MHELIRSRMEALGLATAGDLQRRMAQAPTQVAIRAWLAGESAPDPRWWLALAEALGVTPAALSEADRVDRLASARARDGAA